MSSKIVCLELEEPIDPQGLFDLHSVGIGGLEDLDDPYKSPGTERYLEAERWGHLGFVPTEPIVDQEEIHKVQGGVEFCCTEFDLNGLKSILGEMVKITVTFTKRIKDKVILMYKVFIPEKIACAFRELGLLPVETPA